MSATSPQFCARRWKTGAEDVDALAAQLDLENIDPDMSVLLAVATDERLREKEFGIWQTYDWQTVADEVQSLAAGLADLGFARSDRLIVVGDNRPRLYWAMCAGQSLGGVPVPVYQDSVTEELA